MSTRLRAYVISTHQYEATCIAGTNSSRIAESGGYDENAKQFELKANFFGRRDVAPALRHSAGVGAMTATSYLSFGSVPEWKAVAITYTRRAK